MKLVILLTAGLLANSQASNINRHRNDNKIYNELDKQVDKESLSSSKRSRNFAIITRRPEETIYHKVGAPSTLVCEGIGAPAPNIRWFKNNIPIYEHDLESNKITFSSPNSIARISSTLFITSAKNNDVFTCMVSAKAKMARAASIVYTEEDKTEGKNHRKLIIREPYILTSYKIFIDVVGSTVELPCKTRGFPRPQVQWRNSRGQVIKSNDRMQVLRSGKLVFSSLDWSDMGEYTCEATNAYGSDTATTFVYPAKAE